MIPTHKVINLITAFKSNDKPKIDSSIKEIIAIAEKKGEVKLAYQLRKLYSLPSKPTSKTESNITPQLFNTVDNNLYDRRLSSINESDIILNNTNKEILSEIVQSYKRRKLFESKGIASENKILVYGQPGTGKTLFAYVLAGELGLPIYHVHLDTLISSYLGETGKNIRQIFEQAKKEESILFIDEFDSIAKKRDDQHELGELKRVVTVLLQNIDEFSHNSLLLVATNHEHLLDQAIWRRFDYQMNLDLLDQDSLKRLLKLYLPTLSNTELKLLAFIAQGISGAIIKQLIHKTLRKKILKKSSLDISTLLLEELIKISHISDLDLKSDSNRAYLTDVIEKLRKLDSKYYTFKKIEELTGIPDSTLNHYFIKK
jgi:SpoVK/Ycf46/Vps4 family AAA+-type ATPase